MLLVVFTKVWLFPYYKLFAVCRLAERNCHELVSKLIELGMIEVIYTSDGKSYLTPKELSKEIYEEIIVHGGNHLIVLYNNPVLATFGDSSVV